MNSIALLLAVLVALFSWLAPNHYPPWVSFHAQLAMAVAFVLAWLATLSRAIAPVALSPLTAASLALALVPPLQCAAGLITYAGDAWLGTAYLLGFGLSVWVGQRLGAGFGVERVLRHVAGLLIAAALLSMGLAMYQWLRLSGLGIFAADLSPNGRPFANLGQPNHLATLLFLGLCGVLTLYQERRMGRPGAGLAAVFFTFGLAMTTSRTAWLAMLLLVAGLLALRRRAGLRIGRAEILGLGAVFVGWLVAWPAINDALLLSGGRALATQVDAGPRTILWSTAIEAIGRRPWFGYGWDQALAAQSDVILDRPSLGRLMGNAHNLLLDLLLWVGVPLGAALFGGLLMWGWRHLRLARDPAAVGLLAMLAGIFAHALVELPLSYTYFLLPAGLIAGLLETRHPPPWRRLAPVRWMLAPSALAIGLTAFITVEYLRVEENVRTLRLEVARIGTGRIVSEAPELHLLTQWADYLRFARVEPRPGLSDAELAHMAQVTRRFPFARAQFDEAVAQALNNRPADAALTWRRLCNLQAPHECRRRQAEWRELADEHPQLKSVELPRLP